MKSLGPIEVLQWVRFPEPLVDYNQQGAGSTARTAAERVSAPLAQLLPQRMWRYEHHALVHRDEKTPTLHQTAPDQAKSQESRRIRSGTPLPLGAHVRGGGVNFALFSRHATRVQREFYARAGDAEPSLRIELSPKHHRSGDIWHVWVQGIESGQLYGYRLDGPYQLVRLVAVGTPSGNLPRPVVQSPQGILIGVRLRPLRGPNHWGFGAPARRVQHLVHPGARGREPG